MAKSNASKRSKKTRGKANGKKASSSKQRRIGGLTGAVVDAAVEIGKAAEDIQSSVEHVRKARQKGARVISTAKRAGKSAMRMVGNAIPGRKGKKSKKGKKR
jgi:chemotaxis regulatin CheY-phosphate phosphatase CheZ